MSNNKLLLNSFTSVLQVFLSAILTFILYKYLYTSLGLEKLGLWSLILSINSFFSVSGLGMQGSIVKFVSKYNTRQDYVKTIDVIHTSAISIFILSIFGMIVIYPLSILILKNVLDKYSYITALKLLPIIFTSFIISLTTSIYTASLDGLNRIYIRNIVTFLVSIISFVSVMILLPISGLLGLAYIKLFENLILITISAFVIKKYLPGFTALPKKWNVATFKETFEYSVNFQIINLSIILFDPITKMLLTKFGGISFVGIYEMANKLVLQVRSFIVAAYQTMVPLVSSFKETEPGKIKSFYMSSYRLLLFICVPTFSILIVSSPLISEVWLNGINIKFIIYFSLLAIGWFVNSIIISAYFTNLGTGDVKDNVIGHVMIGCINLVAGPLLGYFFQGSGVVFASTIALTIGCTYQLIIFHYKNSIFRSLLQPDFLYINATCLVFILLHFAFLIWLHSKDLYIYSVSALTISFMMILFLLLFKNPFFQNIFDSLKQKIVYAKDILRST